MTNSLLIEKLNTKETHGALCTDKTNFISLTWSKDETKFLYTAESVSIFKKPKKDETIKQEIEEKSAEREILETNYNFVDGNSEPNTFGEVMQSFSHIKVFLFILSDI